MAKKYASVVYKPDPDEPDDLRLQKYLIGQRGGVSNGLLECAKTFYLPIAIIESGETDPNLAVKSVESVLDLNRQIDLIYARCSMAGIRLSEILPRNHGGGYIPVQAVTQPPVREPVMVKVALDRDDDDSWDEPEIDAVEPQINLDN
jgi:hypothetical protein